MSQPGVSVLAIVPARGGSKGVPRKNVRTLGGEPLIGHTLRVAKASRYVTRVVVSTDDAEVAAVAREYGVEVPFERPADLATDVASQMDVVLHSLREVEGLGWGAPEVIVLLQPTSPLRSVEDVDGTIGLILTGDADSAITLGPAPSHPYYMYTLDGPRPVPLLPPPAGVSRRQDFPEVWVRNGAVYAARRDVLIGNRSFYGSALRAWTMPAERSVNIDTELDFRLAEMLLEGAPTGP